MTNKVKLQIVPYTDSWESGFVVREKAAVNQRRYICSKRFCKKGEEIIVCHGFVADYLPAKPDVFKTPERARSAIKDMFGKFYELLPWEP